MSEQTNVRTAVVLAGIPAWDMSLYHRIRFAVGDPAAWIGWCHDGEDGSHLIVRDIELDRARRSARAASVSCPADHTPAAGLSSDRMEATAEALAEFLVDRGFEEVRVHRDLPVLFAECMRDRGIGVSCDRTLGVTDRRGKDEEEIAALSAAQAATESAIRRACELIAEADAASDGTLRQDGDVLTSERVRALIDGHLIELGFSPRPAIVAGGPVGADCHDHGTGPLRTGEPVIVDVFPRDPRTLYNGDCTRTVVHGDIPGEVAAMHAAVVEAKRAAIEATRAGVSAQSVHEAAIGIVQAHGFGVGLPEPGERPIGRMVHGTGHGLGLDVHEAPLLDLAPSGGSPNLVVGDALTIEPGVYDPRYGGVRVEDLVIVEESGVVNVNRLPEGLSWS